MILQVASVEDRIRPSHPITPAEVLRRHAHEGAALPIGSVRGTKGAGRRF